MLEEGKNKEIKWIPLMFSGLVEQEKQSCQK